MGKLPCLFRRGVIWHYRRRVPSSIRSVIGLTEITKSLHTVDYSTALDRYQTVSATVEQTFNQYRHGDCNDHGFAADTVLHKTATHATQIKAPPSFDQDGLRTLIKTVVEEVVGQALPVKKPSITLSELYRRYMDDPARQRSKKTVMTYESVFKVLVSHRSHIYCSTGFLHRDIVSFLVSCQFCLLAISANARVTIFW